MDSIRKKIRKYAWAHVVVFVWGWGDTGNAKLKSHYSFSFFFIFLRSDDCGVFCIKYTELWDYTVDLWNLFRQVHIPNIRIILGNELYFSKTNKEDKSPVNNLYKEVILVSCVFSFTRFPYCLKSTNRPCILFYSLKID